MEWLFFILECILVTIKWIFVAVFFLVAIILASLTLFSELIARDEKKIREEKDSSWKFFRLIAVLLGILSCAVAWLGYIII